MTTTNSFLKSLKTKEISSSTTSNLSKWKSGIASSPSQTTKRLSEMDVTVSTTKILPLGEIKLQCPYPLPDYESEIIKKRTQFDQDKHKDMVMFPSNDVKYVKVKKEPMVEWYTLYDAKNLTEITPLGKRNNEILSSNIEHYYIQYSQEAYSGSFTSLPSFKPMDGSLFFHVFPCESSSEDDNKRMESIISSKKVSGLSVSGNLNMYDPLIDTTISTEKWISSMPRKLKYISLCEDENERYYKIEVRKEKDSPKCQGVIFLEFCSRIKQHSNPRGNNFELHIQDKIFVFSASSQSEAEQWLNNITKATGLDIEKDKSIKNENFQSFKRNANLQESLIYSELSTLIDYGKENEAMVLKNRNETRFKLVNLYTEILTINLPLSNEPEPSFMPSEKYGKRLIFELNRMTLNVNTFEPYFIHFALYDIKDGYKLSEDFICDLLEDVPQNTINFKKDSVVSLYDMVRGSCEKLSDQRIRRCIFSVPVPHEDIYLVARVYKLYTVSLNNLWELYQKGGTKYEAKLAKCYLESNEVSKKYIMPVGFSFRKIFFRSELDTESKFLPLIKHDTKLSTGELLRFIQDYKSDPKTKTPTMPMEIDCNLSSCPEDTQNLSVITSSYEGLKPFKFEDKKVFREIHDFTVSPKRFRGYPTPINLMYINALHLNFTNLKSNSKAKNFVVVVELYESSKEAAGSPVSSIFSQSSTPSFIRSCASSVICGNPTSFMMDEFKVLLPTLPKQDYHILFSFYHVSIKDKEDSKKKKPVEDVIGYSWIRVFEGQNIRDSREYTLPVISVLPMNYLAYDLEKGTEKAKSLPELKYVDGSGKGLFKFSLLISSTYHTSNSYLSKIFNYVEENGVNANTAGELCKFIKWLYSLESRIMLTHLASIMNLLFKILIESNSFKSQHKEKCEDVQKNSLRLMMLIAGELCRRGRDDMLRGYEKYQFNGQVTVNDTYYHEIILNYLTACIGYGSDPVMTENFYLSCWYFYDVIYKSMTCAALASSRIYTARKAILREKAMENLEELIGLTVCLVKGKLQDDIIGSKNLNRVISKFIIRCFSIVDRGFVMKLLYMVVENYSGMDSTMVSLRFEVLVQLSYFEHFVQLNIPNDSTNSKNYMSDQMSLNEKYRQAHFPLWLVLTKIKEVFVQQNSIRMYGIRLIRNLIIKHHFDDRYNSSDERRSRLYLLYLPFVTMILNYWKAFENAEQKPPAEEAFLKPSYSGTISKTNDGERSPSTKKKDNQVNLLKVDRTGTTQSNYALNDDNLGVSDSSEFHANEVREVLLIFLHIIKSIDNIALIDWWKNLMIVNTKNADIGSVKGPELFGIQGQRRYENLVKFLLILKICLKIFSFRGTNIKNSMRKEKLLSSSYTSKALRSDLAFKLYSSFINLNSNDMESNFSSEVCLIVLDMMEKIQQTFKNALESDQGNNILMKTLVDLHLTMLRLNCSQMVRRNHFASLRQFLLKNVFSFFKGSNLYCYSFCVEMLRLSSSSLESVRNEARMFLYLMLRTDLVSTGIPYHRAYVQLIIASSKVLEEKTSLSLLYESMEELNNVVKLDGGMKTTDFSSEVRDLTRRLRNIIRLTFRFKDLESDPEALVDAHCSIANSFSEAPELRQTWLEKIANLHMSYGNFSEAAMCYIHAAAIIAQTLKRRNILADGPFVFKPLTPNITVNELSFREDALTDEGSHSIEEFLSLLNSAANALYKAERYEIIAEVYKISLPFLEKDQDYKGLSEVYGLLKQAYDKIVESSGKRLLGAYYRVFFFGRSFKEDHESEYIYKEPKVTSLPEIVDRLRNIYEPKCKNLTIIMESTKVRWSELDQKNDYLQINVVKPNIKDPADLKSAFYTHHNIGSFKLETPFTRSGKAHGNIGDQCKRITVFQTLQAFPFIKKRIRVIKSEITELTPLQVAISEMETQVSELTAVVRQEPPDMKRLQLKLQGSVSVTVNAGPLAYAKFFLDPSEKDKLPKQQIELLESTFKEFLNVCSLALELNGRLIKDDQVEYHKGLMEQYTLLIKNLCEYLQIEIKQQDV